MGKKITAGYIIGSIVGSLFDFLIVTCLVMGIEYCFAIPLGAKPAIGVWLVSVLINYWLAKGKKLCSEV